MEHQKILNLLNEPKDSNFVTKKSNIFNDLLNGNYDIGNEIIYNTDVWKGNLCDYNDAYILVKGDITVTAVHATKVAFRNCGAFTKCITKIDATTINDAEYLYLVMPM